MLLERSDSNDCIHKMIVLYYDRQKGTKGEGYRFEPKGIDTACCSG